MTPSPTTDVDTEFLIRLRRVLNRLSRELNMSAAASGLTPTQAAIFVSIGRRGPIGLSSLADHEKVNATMLSRVIAKLEHLALVERVPDPDDGRAYIVRHTDKGRQTHERIKSDKSRWLEERLKHLDADRAAALLAALPALEDLTTLLGEEGTPVADR